MPKTVRMSKKEEPSMPKDRRFVPQDGATAQAAT